MSWTSSVQVQGLSSLSATDYKESMHTALRNFIIQAKHCFLLPSPTPPPCVRHQQKTNIPSSTKGNVKRGSCHFFSLQIKALGTLRKCFLTCLRVIWVPEKFPQKLKWIAIGVRVRENMKYTFLFCDFFSLHCILLFPLSPSQSPSFLLPPFEWGFYTKDSWVWSLKPQNNNIQK